MNAPLQSPTGLDQIGPILDQAINQLSEADRKAILFRFFEQASFRTVGEALGVNEDAARMRVSRALEKLHWILRKRGFAGSSAVLGALLTGSAVMSAPSGLAATVSSAALTNLCCGNSSATLMKVILMTKLKTSLVGALLVAGVAASVVIHRQAKARIEAQRATLEQQSGQIAQLSAEKGRLSNLLANASADKPRDDISELLRLRGEVGVLKQQLAESKAKQNKNTPNVQPNPNATSDPQEEEKRVLMAKMNFTKQSMLALLNYATQNQGLFPTNLATAEPGLADEAHQRNLAMDQFEIVYQGSLNNLTNPGSTIIMREKDPQQTPRGMWQRVYGFADGSSQVRESTDGNFQSWEQQHIVMASPTVQPGQ